MSLTPSKSIHKRKTYKGITITIKTPKQLCIEESLKENYTGEKVYLGKDKIMLIEFYKGKEVKNACSRKWIMLEDETPHHCVNCNKNTLFLYFAHSDLGDIRCPICNNEGDLARICKGKKCLRNRNCR